MDSAQLHLGFLTIQHDSQGFSGGYLLTNAWGRPLEFRLTSTVQPTKVQQLLYGPTLRPYLCADLLGKSLVEKAALPPSLVITDCDAALNLRLHIPVPLAWLAPPEQAPLSAQESIVIQADSYSLISHRHHPEDAELIKRLLHASSIADLVEPFSRIREALTEARKSATFSKAA